jgi:uncharacterized protein (TIGR03086 family)
VPTDSSALLDQLSRSFTAVGDLISTIRSEQWTAPTPCTEWTVAQVVGHLVGMNRVFVAMLAGLPRPPRGRGVPDGELEPAYRESAATLLVAFSQPGILDRGYDGPLGSATGAQRLQIRLYDLLAHGWDLARATGQPMQLPDDAADTALAFARIQLSDEARPGRFNTAGNISSEAPATDRLAVFLGRRVDWTP